jgi:UDP-N-acetylglucosamine 2-epimerase
VRGIMGDTVQQKCKNKALIVTSRNVHFTVLWPIIKELLKRGWIVRVLRFEKIWERVENLLSKTTRRRSLESFYVGAQQKKGVKKSRFVYNIIARLILFFLDMFRVERPDVILVLTDSSPPCRLAVMVGRLARIPSLLLLHVGVVGKNYECPEFLVDKIAVTGDFAKELLIKCGVDKNKIVVTGRPLYDALIHLEEYFDKDKVCDRLGLDPTKKIVVYTTENLTQRENENTVKAICKAIKNFSDLQFVIKVHPSEFDFSIYQRVARTLGINALIIRDANIYEVLYASDLVITGFSATALDAIMLNKPVITINFTGLKDPVPYAESGVAIGVNKEKDLIIAINNGLYNEDIKKDLGRLERSLSMNILTRLMESLPRGPLR